MSDAYRIPVTIAPDTDPVGIRDHAPLDTCPECGSNNDGYHGKWEPPWPGWVRVVGDYCSPAKRTRYGFMRLRKCSLPEVHIHQWCRNCKMSWVTKTKKDARKDA